MADHLAYLTEKDSWKDADLALKKVESLASQLMKVYLKEKDSWRMFGMRKQWAPVKHWASATNLEVHLVVMLANLMLKDSQMADRSAYLKEKDLWKDADLALRKVETLASQMMKDSWMVGYLGWH